MELSEMRKLKKGWDSYGADPPNEIAIGNAERFLKYKPERVKPSVIGGVGITFIGIYIECYNSGAVYALFKESLDVQKVDESFISKYLDNAKQTKKGETDSGYD